MSSASVLFQMSVLEPPPVSWLRRVLFGSVNPSGAIAALTNLYATGGAPTREQVAVALKRHGIVAPEATGKLLEQFCAEALKRILRWEPGRIPEGRRQVRRLAESLDLPPEALAAAERDAASEHVRTLVKEALEDRSFTEAERTAILAAGKALGLADAATDKMIRDEIQPLLRAAIEGAFADRRFSPTEEQNLRRLAADLGVNLALESSAAAHAERYRLLWEIENGQLPEIAVPISLQRKEVCHYTCQCSWRELRTRTVRVNYSGPTARIRIMKGVSWRVGSIAAQRVTETNLVEVTRGTLYVTNKRLILDGTTGNKALTWRTVFGQELFADAIKLEKSSGKDPYLFISDSEIEMAAAIFAGAMAASE